MTISLFGHLIGFVGMICVCIAFWLVTTERTKPTEPTYLLTNLVGAILLIISLIIHFNLGSFVIEVFWIGVSVNGLIKYYRG